MPSNNRSTRNKKLVFLALIGALVLVGVFSVIPIFDRIEPDPEELWLVQRDLTPQFDISFLGISILKLNRLLNEKWGTSLDPCVIAQDLAYRYGDGFDVITLNVSNSETRAAASYFLIRQDLAQYVFPISLVVNGSASLERDGEHRGYYAFRFQWRCN